MPSRTSAHALAALALCAASNAQVTYTRVIAPGDPAPGSPSGTFSGPQNPHCLAPGRVALLAILANTPNSPLDNRGVWQGTSAGTALLALSDQALPSTGGRKFYTATQTYPVQNRAGASAFLGTLEFRTGTDEAAVFYSAGGPARVAVQQGDAAPAIPGGTFGQILSYTDLSFGEADRLTFVAPINNVPSGTNRALYTGNASTRTYAPVARTGNAAPLPGAPTFSSINTPSINGAGDVAFFANLAGGPPSFALFVKPAAGALQSVMAQGDAAPGFPAGWTVVSIIGQNSGLAMINDLGEFAIAANVQSAGGGSASQGLWRGAPGALSLIAKRNDHAAGHPNPAAVYSTFSPIINRSGAVFFYANLANSAPQNDGFWIAPPGQAPRLLALLPQQAPDMPAGIQFNSISTGGISFNNRGEGLINASLNYAVSSTPANGIFAGRPGRLRKVVASGDLLEVAPGVTRTVVSVLCWTGAGPDMGRPISINDRGEVAFSCSFVGGGSGTFIAQLPNPCPGDATGDDTVDFFDLNLVLSQYGMTGPGLSGDINGDGAVNFTDLNALLSAFGTTC